MAVVNSQPPSSIMRYCGTQIEDSSTIPTRSPGCRARVPFTMRSVTAMRRGDPQKDGLDHGDEALVGVGVEGFVEYPGLIGHVEHGRDPVLHEGGP